MCNCEMVGIGQNNSTAEAHGMKGTKMYQTWKSMKARCFSNKKSEKYYKGKGIMICKQWSSFSEFYKDMGDKPTEKHSIDRIDSDKGYCPHNCRWATKHVQAANREFKDRKLPTGVRKQSSCNRYYSAIRHNGVYYYIGSFRTPEEAHDAYLQKKIELNLS